MNVNIKRPMLDREHRDLTQDYGHLPGGVHQGDVMERALGVRLDHYGPKYKR